MCGDDVVASPLAALTSTTPGSGLSTTHPPSALARSPSLYLVIMLSRRLVHLARGRALRADAALLSRGWYALDLSYPARAVL